MTPTLIYCYDAYCGWCYGFGPVVKKIAAAYHDRFYVDVYSGGMMTGENALPIEKIAPYILKSYKRVEEITGIQFGEDFLWHIKNPEKSDWVMNSEKPAIALCIVKELLPDKQLAFASDLQYSLNFEGRDLDDNEAYRHLLEKYGLPEDDFYAKLRSDKYRQEAHYEFAVCKQLNVTGFPALFLQVKDAKFYLLSSGFADFETVNGRIVKIMEELARLN